MNLCSLYKKFQKEKIKMTKRILSLLLAVMMILGTLVVVSAADEERAENTWAVTILKDLNVLQGLSEDDLGLDVAIKRYEMSLFITRALTGKTNDVYWMGAKNETPFTDLDGFEYAGAMTWTYNYGIILGRDAKTFDPQGYVTYQEAIAMIVRAWAEHYMGGAENLMIVDSIHYPWRYIELADYLGLTNDVDPTTEYTEVLDRGSVAQLVYNLLAFDIDNFEDIDYDPNNNPTIAESIFGLVSSDKDGDVVEVTGITDKGVVETNPAIADLNKSDFAAFDLEAVKGDYYKVVYYTRYQVKTNPITGAAIIDKSKSETTVISIVKTTAEGSKFVNKPGDRNFSLVYEVTAKDDKGNATEWKLTGIKAGETTYALVGDNKITLKLINDTLTVFEKLDKNEKAMYDLALDALYATLKLADTTGDGKIDTATVDPYVFAGIYKEVVVKENGKDTNKTTYEFAGYAVVAGSEVVETVNGSFTWTAACKDKDGKYTVDFTCTTANTKYVAKATDTTLATAEKLALVTIDKYDIRTGLANYFEIDGAIYGYKYTALLGWEASAEYYEEAQDGDLLADLYANKAVADKDLGTKNKYVNAYVLDGKLVALELTTPTGTVTPPTPEKPTAEYAGIIDFAALSASAPKKGDSVVKLVNGKYYLEIAADVVVDGVAQSKILVYLADAKGYEFDVTSSLDSTAQQDAWTAAENTKIATAYAKLAALAGKNAFYTKDANNNFVVVTDVKVNGINYLTHVGGAALIAPADKQVITNLEYAMDRASEDYITYNLVDDGKDKGEKFKTGIATNETVWLFVTDDSQTLKTGVPEYLSTFKAATSNDLIVVDNTIVAFATDVDGFDYTMFQEATYAIYNGSTALDMDVRDGYYYYTVKNLFTGKDFIMKVLETSAMVKELNKAATTKTEIIIAVTADKDHVLLETYDIEQEALAAIASLSYGETAFEDLGKNYTTDKLVERIKAQYNLSTVEAKLMTGTINVLDATGVLTLNTGKTVAGDYYVFFTPASGDTAASYVVFICE